MKRSAVFLQFLLILAGAARLGAATATFTSGGPVTFANLGATRTGSPYPSTLSASGIAAGSITSVKVTINGLSHARPDDIQMLLVAPAPWSARLVFWADAGGAGTAVNNATITFDDAASVVMPDAGPLTSSASSSFKPTCYDAQSNIATEFPGVTVSPATDVAGPGLGRSATFTSVFGGAHDPNGTWSLYITDDVPSTDNGSFTSWSLEITTSETTVGTTTTLSSSANPAFTGASVTLTALVLKQSDSLPVTTGSVTFREGAATLAANVAVNASGQASFTTAALAEGDHLIVADYNPGSGLLASTASLNQRLDNATSQAGSTFSNTGPLTLLASSGAASVFPSHIFVTGLAGSISKVTLSVAGVSIDRPDDLELLLVGPAGHTFLVLGDAGGTAVGISGINLTFDDAAGSQVPDASPPASGTYRPSSFSTTSIPAPAPSGPYSQPAPQGSSTFANVFNGAAPNGTWSLFAFDDVAGAGGSISGGWSLTFTTTSDASTTTTVSSTPNPSVTGDSVTFTATVTSGGNPVILGSVTFREGATTLAGPVALDGAGQAAFSTTTLTEGNHIISADYGGSPGLYNLSSGSTSQTVDGPTVVNGTTFCNEGGITIPATAPSIGNVYPSHITVSGLAGPATKVTLDLKGLTIDRPDDLEFLLVSPSGAAFIVLGDAGGTAVPIAGLNLTLDDNAASFVPNDGPMASGTYKPTSVNTSPVGFPAPAPIAPYAHPGPFGSATFASLFNGTSPNGTWSLYALDDVTGVGASISGGWCLNFTTDQPPVATTDTLFRDKDRPVKVLIADLLANDTNPDGAAPTFVNVAAASASGASVHVVGSWISYEAVPGANSDDTFGYTITDGTSTANGTVNVNVSQPDTQTANLTLRTAGGDVVVGLAGIPGRMYQLQVTTSLSQPISWSNLGSPLTADSAGRGSYTDAAAPPRFYRAIEP